MNKRFSVVIPAYTENRWEQLVKAVSSVEQQTLKPYEIIVVIDHNPKLMELARQHLQVTVIANHYLRGLNGARNSAVAAASGEVVAFLDDDATPAPDWLAQLSQGYACADVVGVGGSIVPDWMGAKPRWFPEEFYWVVGCTYRGMPTSDENVRNLIGCNMSCLRAVINDIGGFNVEIGHASGVPRGDDETEFCIRVLQRWPEKSFLYRPTARVYHQVPPSRANWRYFGLRCYLEGRSKATLSHLVGAKDSLASEKTYAFKTLPRGILRGLGDSLSGDLAGLTRSAMIIIGLGVTTLAYLIGRFQTLLIQRKQAAIKVV